MSFEKRQSFRLEDGEEPRPTTRNYQEVKLILGGVFLGACLMLGAMYGVMQMQGSVGTPQDKVGLVKSCNNPVAAQVPSPDASAGIFMGSKEERKLVEKEFNVIFSSDPGLWQENCYSFWAGVSPTGYHHATAIESSSAGREGLIKKVMVISEAVLAYRNYGYPEYFVPKPSFDPAQPTGGLAPSQIYVVRGYIDRNTRIIENVYGDGQLPAFSLNTFLGSTEVKGGIEAKLKYRRVGGFEFIVTVSPVSPPE